MEKYEQLQQQISGLSREVERLKGRLEVANTKLDSLKTTPERVSTLENAVAKIEAEFKAIGEDLDEVKTEQNNSKELLIQIKQDMSNYHTRLTTVGGIVAFVATVAQIYSAFKTGV